MGIGKNTSFEGEIKKPREPAWGKEEIRKSDTWKRENKEWKWKEEVWKEKEKEKTRFFFFFYPRKAKQEVLKYS